MVRITLVALYQDDKMTTGHTFNNYGYTLNKVPPQIMDILRAEREKHATDDPISRYMNNNLAGQINKEHSLAHIKEIPLAKDFLLRAAQTYATHFNLPLMPNEVVNSTSDKWSIEIVNIWMNIQEQGEYNPIHSHAGVMSFVIWFEIPYDLQEEKTLNNARYSSQPANGDFFFHPINILGELDSVPMNIGKDKEGTICVFHAKLLHSVSPFFTTNKQRVTFSGNFAYKKVEHDFVPKGCIEIPLYTHPAKTLTDEEIHDLIVNKVTDADMIREALRKAQEK